MSRPETRTRAAPTIDRTPCSHPLSDEAAEERQRRANAALRTLESTKRSFRQRECHDDDLAHAGRTYSEALSSNTRRSKARRTPAHSYQQRYSVTAELAQVQTISE
jgi:hypothetical protein